MYIKRRELYVHEYYSKSNKLKTTIHGDHWPVWVTNVTVFFSFELALGVLVFLVALSQPCLSLLVLPNLVPLAYKQWGGRGLHETRV